MLQSSIKDIQMFQGLIVLRGRTREDGWGQEVDQNVIFLGGKGVSANKVPFECII